MDDGTARLFAGHMGVTAVVANILIDKGIVSEAELRERFMQAHAAAMQCAGAPMTAHVLAEMIRYLDPMPDERPPAN